MAQSPRHRLNGQGVRCTSGVWELECEKYTRKETEVCEELRRKMDVSCIQEVRWRGHGARFLGVEKRRYKLC